MITLSDTYTGRRTWGKPRVGSLIAIPESIDAREYDAAGAWMFAWGVGLDFVRWMPRKKCNVYRVMRRGE